MIRYFDTATGNQSAVQTATTIIDTDPRVANFFAPLPDGYRRAYDANGLPINELIQAPTAEVIAFEKWMDVNKARKDLTVTTAAGNKFAANPDAITAISRKAASMLSSDSCTWYEDWGSFSATKVELQEALNLANDADQGILDALLV